MPAPASPTDFSITPQAAGSPVVTLEWDHDGVDLDRFEVLTRASDEDPWVSEIIDIAASFGDGPYSYDTTSLTGQDWAVRALASDGSVST